MGLSRKLKQKESINHFDLIFKNWMFSQILIDSQATDIFFSRLSTQIDDEKALTMIFSSIQDQISHRDDIKIDSRW